MATEPAAEQTLTAPAGWEQEADREHVHGQQPVVEQDPGPHPNVLGEGRIGGGNFSGFRALFRSEHDAGAGLEPERFGQISDPDPRALEIVEQGRGYSPFCSHLLDRADPLAAQLRSAV